MLWGLSRARHGRHLLRPRDFLHGVADPPSARSVVGPVQRSNTEVLGALAIAVSALALSIAKPWEGVAAYLSAADTPAAPHASPTVETVAVPQQAPVIEVVFVLDTTGSMSGLLEGAKKKIWSIANTIASGQPRPELRVGLVAYRDLGDTYVTSKTAMTGDLDEVYAGLLQLQASGGGDFPEHVNEGLRVALREMQWSEDPQVMKMVYLVGDAPAHDDYDPQLTSATMAKEAHARGIALNAVQCGENHQTSRAFKELAQVGHGEYLQIAADGGVSLVATPFDEDLATLNRQLADLSLGYGSAEQKSRAAKKRHRRKAMRSGVAADAASVGAKTGKMYDEDLVTAIRKGKVSLEELSAPELPSSFAGMSKKEQAAALTRNMEEREALAEEIEALSAKRDAFLDETSEGKDGFDAKVNESLRNRAADFGISY